MPEFFISNEELGKFSKKPEVSVEIGMASDDFDAPSSLSTPKEELKKETEKMTGLQRFGAGIGGGMVGTYLGAKQLGADIGAKLGVVSPETQQRLRQEGAEHKDIMSSLKLGSPGALNPASVGEFVGETPAMLIPGGGGVRALKAAPYVAGMAPLARNMLLGAAGGAAGGAVGSAIEPLSPEQSRPSEIMKGAIGGAAGGAVLGAGARGVGRLGEAVKGRVGPIEQRIDFYLRKAAPYTATKYTNLQDRQAGIAKRAEGVKNLYKMQDEINLTDEFGNPTGKKLPENQFQFLQYIDQAKKKLFNMYDMPKQIAEQAGLTVKPNGVKSYLNSIITNNTGEFTTGQKRYAKQMLKDFDTDFTPTGAQNRVAGYNEKLAAYYRNKDVGFADNARIQKKVLDIFRNDLTNTINQVDPKYSDLRRAWGSINELEQDVLRSFERELRSKGKASSLDFLTGEQVLYAVAKGNPHYLIPAAGTYAMKKFSKYLTNPDRAIKRMFDETGKALREERILKPQPYEPNFEMRPHTGKYVGESRGLVPTGVSRRPQTVDAEFREITPLTGGERAGLLPSPKASGTINAPWNPKNVPGGVANRMGNIQVPPETKMDLQHMAKQLYEMGYPASEIQGMIEQEIMRRGRR